MTPHPLQQFIEQVEKEYTKKFSDRADQEVGETFKDTWLFHDVLAFLTTQLTTLWDIAKKEGEREERERIKNLVRETLPMYITVNHFDQYNSERSHLLDKIDSLTPTELPVKENYVKS